MTRRMRGWTLLLGVLALSACATGPRLEAPPPALAEAFPIVGIENARFWPDLSPEPLLAESARMAAREAAVTPPGPLPPAHFLAISGGADQGAYGAGLMAGWTAAGTRPEFRIVTGISAGALIAPFAFLGPAYDEQLRELFTDYGKTDLVIVRRIVGALLFGDSLADTGPLFRLISRNANAAMLAAIAEQYARGRLLLIGTVNLDLQRPVIWNIGAIAASGHPDALGLFRSILLASASIPGAFPPVMIDVEAAGRRHQEMHVDGGAAAQVFLYPSAVDLRAQARTLGVDRVRTAWVIRNDRLELEPATTPRRLFAITVRSLLTLLHFGGINDIRRIHATAERDGVGFRLAYIDAGFTVPRDGAFEPAYMRALFDHGFAQARDGRPWRTAPPGFPTQFLPGG